MDLDELRALLAVAETGSVLAASERLRMTRTTLRRRLESLEARIGSGLISRGPTGAALTPAGEEAALHARAILREAGALLASARAAADEPGAPLRVIAPTGLPPHAVAVLFAAVRQAHPELRFDLRVREDPLASGLDDCDLAFHFGNRIEEGPWITRVVHSMREVLVVSPAWIAARGAPATLDDLAGLPLVAWRRPDADPTLLPTLDGVGHRIVPCLLSSDIHLLRSMALQGTAIAFVPEGRLTDPLEPPGAVVPVLTDVVGRDCPFRMVAPPMVARTPRVRRLLDEINQTLDALQLD